ncbi:MAG: glycosyltransferase family 9 protein [Fimbriimonadaceae bacterium]
MSDRVLVWLKPQYLGDAVMALPLIDSLIAAGRNVAVAAGPVVLDLLRDRSDRVDLVPVERMRRFQDVQAAAARFRKEGYTAAILVNRSFRSALTARLAGIPLRVGHAAEGRGPLLTHRVPYPKDRPEWECGLDLLRAVGWPATALEGKVGLEPDEIRVGRELRGRATIGIQPGARYRKKQYPLPMMAEVAAALMDDGHEIVLLGGREESEDAERFLALIGGRGQNLVGRCRLRESMAVAAGLRAMVGNDTGMMHAAAAVGGPTVTLFGPTSASKWGHADEVHLAIQAPGHRLERLAPRDVLLAARSVLRPGGPSA